MKTKILFLIILIPFFACQNSKVKVDKIFYNGQIMSFKDSNIKVHNVMVLKDGKIFDIGSASLLNKYKSDSIVDLKKQFVYPGFIDAHCHFYGYAKNLLICDLKNTKSWEEIIEKLKLFRKENPEGWLLARGWDQNDWENKNYPSNELLNQYFSDVPVFLKRIDGHAAIVNNKVLELASINSKTTLNGGEIVLKNNIPTGVLIDNAVDLVENIVPSFSTKQMIEALKKAEKNCFEVGLTTLADAGLDLDRCLLIDSLLEIKNLNIFTYLMLNPNQDCFEFAKKNGIIEKERIKISSFKLYADGSLGSRGAKLKKNYCDHPHHSGFFIKEDSFYIKTCQWIYNNTKYQANTHCIGDSANRYILDVYSQFLTHKDDRRWRIEHAQVIDPQDIPLFRKFNVIPSVQPTHATSDAPWVKDRICSERMEGAYAYQSLLKSYGKLPLGTDFPVEEINPLFTFYSAVTRKNAQNEKQIAFIPQEQLSRKEALLGMTYWAAWSCFLEHRKGHLNIGADADFVILNQDLLNCSDNDILKTKIIHTYCLGECVY